MKHWEIGVVLVLVRMQRRSQRGKWRARLERKEERRQMRVLMRFRVERRERAEMAGMDERGKEGWYKKQERAVPYIETNVSKSSQ